jgi:hypothetical protein
MLYSTVTKPQVKLTIDEIDGACASANCEYEYGDYSVEVEAQSVSSLDVTITGIELTASDSTVVFGGASCGALTVNEAATELTCTLEHAPYGGDHEVELYNSNGLVTRTGLSTINVPVTVSAVSPDTGVN